MLIKFSPFSSDERLIVDREGDVLYVNGEVFDFTPLEEGSTLPAEAIDSKWFFGEVIRDNGLLTITLRLPFGPNAPESTRFPEDILVSEDGPVQIPVYEVEKTEEVVDEY